MSPHDLELKRYNDIMLQLVQMKEYAIHNARGVTEPGYSDAFDRIAIVLTGVIDLFIKYSERQHD